MIIVRRIRGKIIGIVLCCVQQLCTVVCTHISAVLTVNCLLDLGLVLCVCLGLVFCVFFWFSVDYFVLVLFAFIV